MREASPCYVPKNDDNKHTARGTVLHEAMEHMSDEKVEHNDQWAFYEATGRLQGMGLLKDDGKFIFEGEREQKLTLYDDEDELLFGTADLLLFDHISKEIFLIDYKFGSWPVPQPKDNLQLTAYAAAALQKYPDFLSCNTLIIQPGHEYEMYTVSHKEGAHIVEKVSKLIQDCKDAEATGNIKPSIKACMFCDRFVGCPGPMQMVEDLL
tara:strand:+ start:33361 stop:33987 length:627 start_codon:yes stop_codon:yes gene_type:complete